MTPCSHQLSNDVNHENTSRNKNRVPGARIYAFFSGLENVIYFSIRINFLFHACIDESHRARHQTSPPAASTLPGHSICNTSILDLPWIQYADIYRILLLPRD